MWGIMMRKSRRMIWSAVALSGLVLAAIVGNRIFFADHSPMVANVQPFTLEDHNGNPITHKAFAGKPTALFFGFTNCPEICPTSMFELQGIKEELKGEAAELKAFFVTLDPGRDTQELLKDYVGSFGPFLTGITGDEEDILKLAKAWNVYSKKVTIDDSYTVDHTADMFLIDRHGKVVNTIGYGETRESAIEKVRQIL